MDEALRRAATRLAGSSDTPRLDAELLLAHALGTTREAVLLRKAGSAVPPEFEALVERRASGEPLAYITGTRDFWTITLAVAPDVLIPRPDSETLIDAAVSHFGTKGPQSILDLGTGPGTLLLAALDQWPGAYGLGIDRSTTALAIARANADRLGLADRARFVEGNWSEGIMERFDLILCNPPYVETSAVLASDVAEHEPHEALFAGPDGLDDYRVLAPQIAGLLNPGGMAAIEIGFAQRAPVTALFASKGLRIEARQDLAGRDRAIVLYPQ